MSTYPLRLLFVNIARLDANKTEDTKNRAPWIKKLWPATTYPEGYANRQPYCAAGVAYCLQQWLKIPAVLSALGLNAASADKWRCKSAGAFNWEGWARNAKLTVLPRNCILRTGDLVIYNKSHIEIVTDDNGTATGPFVAIGYNTNAAGSRDGEGCFEKPRNRADVKCFIRILE